jgi:hypothetical protein
MVMLFIANMFSSPLIVQSLQKKVEVRPTPGPRAEGVAAPFTPSAARGDSCPPLAGTMPTERDRRFGRRAPQLLEAVCAL